MNRQLRFLVRFVTIFPVLGLIIHYGVEAVVLPFRGHYFPGLGALFFVLMALVLLRRWVQLPAQKALVKLIRFLRPAGRKSRAFTAQVAEMVREYRASSTTTAGAVSSDDAQNTTPTNDSGANTPTNDNPVVQKEGRFIPWVKATFQAMGKSLANWWSTEGWPATQSLAKEGSTSAGGYVSAKAKKFGSWMRKNPFTTITLLLFFFAWLSYKDGYFSPAGTLCFALGLMCGWAAVSKEILARSQKLPDFDKSEA